MLLSEVVNARMKALYWRKRLEADPEDEKAQEKFLLYSSLYDEIKGQRISFRAALRLKKKAVVVEEVADDTKAVINFTVEFN